MTPLALPGQLPTPSLVVDGPRLERNLAAMAKQAAGIGVALRPHAKTHKCVEIARRQLAQGAHGLTVATVGEAEVFAHAGMDDLFIAYPLWARDAGPRLSALLAHARLRIGVDSVPAAEVLGEVLGPSRRPGSRRGGAQVLVEVDCGHHRSGVSPEEVSQIAVGAERAGLQVAGVFTYPGHAYRPGQAQQAARDEAAALAEAADRLTRQGFDAAVRSGGSTPTAHHTHTAAVSEVRPGVYVANDAQQVQLGTCPMDQVAVYVVSTVVSVPAPNRFVVDAGSKVLGADRPEWMPGHGFLPGFPAPRHRHQGSSSGRAELGAPIHQLSEHHAVVALAPDDPLGPAGPPSVGDRVAVVPNHVCSAVNQVDELTVVAEGAVVDRWAVAARGRNN